MDSTLPHVPLIRMELDLPTLVGGPVLVGLPVPVVANSLRLSIGPLATLLVLGRFASSSCSGLAAKVAVAPQVVVQVAKGR